MIPIVNRLIFEMVNVENVCVDARLHVIYAAVILNTQHSWRELQRNRYNLSLLLSILFGIMRKYLLLL